MSTAAGITPPEFVQRPHDEEGDRRRYLVSQFAGKRYVSVETFRRDGQGVKTPVWFVEEDSGLYVWTSPISGKVKRIKNNPKVRIAPCSVTGKISGPWVDAEAQIVPTAKAAHATRLFRKKYGLQFWLVARVNKGKQVVIELAPN